jgi:hypothetical protein
MGIDMDRKIRKMFMGNDLMRNRMSFCDSGVVGFGSAKFPRKSWFLSVLVTYLDIFSQVVNNQILAIIPARPWGENCRKPLQNHPSSWRLGEP